MLFDVRRKVVRKKYLDSLTTREPSTTGRLTIAVHRMGAPHSLPVFTRTPAARLNAAVLLRPGAQ